MNRHRRKELKQDPSKATAGEIRWMLSLVHEVTNQRIQIETLQNEIKRLHTLYGNTVQEAAVKGQKIVQHAGKQQELKQQITTLGHTLDNERKLIPEAARRTIKVTPHPDNQACGVGPYNAPAPTAENL